MTLDAPISRIVAFVSRPELTPCWQRAVKYKVAKE